MLNTKTVRLLVKLALGETRYQNLHRAYTDPLSQFDRSPLRTMTFADVDGFSKEDINLVAKSVKKFGTPGIRVYGTKLMADTAVGPNRYNYLKIAHVMLG